MEMIQRESEMVLMATRKVTVGCIVRVCLGLFRGSGTSQVAIYA